MAAFLAVAALLCLLVLAVLLRPLWRDARGVALGIAIVVLASATLLYRIVGTPQALDAAKLKAPETLGDAIVQLQDALKREPDQAEGWRLLGMAWQREGKAIESRDAYAKAASLAVRCKALIASGSVTAGVSPNPGMPPAPPVPWA